VRQGEERGLRRRRPRPMLTDRDERVFLDARRHGIVLVRPLARALAATVVGGALLALAWPLAVAGALLMALGALLSLRAVWLWERTRVVITSDKVFVVQGTLRRRATAVRLRAIEAVEVDQSLPGRLLGYGTVVVGPLALDNVAEPKRVCRLVEQLAS
jgi:membrane protein YdbS with pleckstrin-like domain